MGRARSASTVDIARFAVYKIWRLAACCHTNGDEIARSLNSIFPGHFFVRFKRKKCFQFHPAGDFETPKGLMTLSSNQVKARWTCRRTANLELNLVILLRAEGGVPRGNETTSSAKGSVLPVVSDSFGKQREGDELSVSTGPAQFLNHAHRAVSVSGVNHNC